MVGGAIRDECHREAGSSSPLLFHMELPAAGVGASPGMGKNQVGMLCCCKTREIALAAL